MRDRSTGWPAADLTRQQGKKRRGKSELSVYPRRTRRREVIEAAYARSDLFEHQRVLMVDWARYLAQGIGGRTSSNKATSPAADQSVSYALSQVAIQARLSSTTHVRVFNSSAFPLGTTVVRATPLRGG